VPAAATGLAKAWRWWRPPTSPAYLDAYANDLADEIRTSETQRLEQLGVTRGAAIDLAYHPLAQVQAAGGKDIGSLRDVLPYYQHLDPLRLVILGEPGAGKTVLALHLLLDLIDHRRSVGPERLVPVPVRANITSWNPADNFDNWLASTLVAGYGLRRVQARRLIETGRILPVLDGLDEMDPQGQPPERARAALETLNRPPWLGRPLITSCRSSVYEQARRTPAGRRDAGLHRATAVTVRPLTPDEIRAHLHRAQRDQGAQDQPWQEIQTRLRAEPTSALASALSTPWLLTLTVSHLRHGSPTATRQLLSAEDDHAAQEALFEALIPTAIEGTVNKGPPRHYTAAKVEFWLKRLAEHSEQQLTHGRGTEIRMHDLWRMAGARAPHLVHALTVGLASVLTVGLAFGLWFGPVVGLVFGLIVGLSCGLRVGLTDYSPPPRRLVLGTSRIRLTAMLRVGLPFGLATGLAVGLIVGLAALGVGFTYRLAGGLTYGLAAGLPAGLTAGLVFGLVARDLTPSNPRHVIRDDALAGLTVALTVALAFGLALGILFGLRLGFTAGLTYGPMFGLPFGLPFGLTAGLMAAQASGRYSSATLLMTSQGTFTRRPAVFLDWAHHAGLLRVTGAVYQFRHDTYRRWLIARETTNWHPTLNTRDRLPPG
jgi:hypothetical protein